jgi:LDH2 family malate/lactate/ureidoglycolate dehydrogenase
VGALQPAAGHKGYGIALLIESLAGALSGAAMTWQVGNWMWDDGTKPTEHGAAFVAIDTQLISPGGKFAERIDTLIDEVHAAPRADGVERLYVPGEMEWERYAQSRQNGIPLPPDVVASLREAAELSGVEPPPFSL